MTLLLGVGIIGAWQYLGNRKSVNQSDDLPGLNKGLNAESLYLCGLPAFVLSNGSSCLDSLLRRKDDR